jgi:hypothetical protein
MKTAGHCTAMTAAGTPCRAYAMSEKAFCLTHDPEREATRTLQRRKGGSVRQAQKALAKARIDALAKFGITEPIPDLDDIEACRRFLLAIAGKVLQGSISPAAANALSTIVRVSKELLSLEVDVKLAEQLDALDAKDLRS